MLDTNMGLPLNDQALASALSKNKPAMNADDMNVFFQQSFNKMLSSFLTDSSSNTDFMGDNSDQGDDLGFTIPSLPFQDQSAQSGSDPFNLDQSLTSLLGNSELEKLYTMNSYSALIGKEVEYIDPTTREKLSGKIQKVVVDNGTPYLQLEDGQISVEDIVSVA